MAQWLRIHLPMQETRVQSLGWEDPLEEEMATHPRILAQRVPWTEGPGGLQFMGLQRVRHGWTHTYISRCQCVCVSLCRLVYVGFLFCFVCPIWAISVLFHANWDCCIITLQIEHPQALPHSFAFRTCPAMVVLTLECALESWGGLIKPQMVSPHPHSFWVSEPEVGPKNLHL